jgi:transposase
VAALVYQNYCIEKQSIEEISKEFNVNEESVQLMVQYYDKKAAS